MSSAVNIFVHVLRKRSKKYLAQKVALFGSPGWIPMFQPPLDSSRVALIWDWKQIFPSSSSQDTRWQKLIEIRHFNTRFTIQIHTKWIKHAIFHFLGHTSYLGINQKLYWCLGTSTTSLHHPAQDDSWKWHILNSVTCYASVWRRRGREERKRGRK